MSPLQGHFYRSVFGWAVYVWPVVSATGWTAAIVCGEVAPLSPSSAASHALPQSAGGIGNPPVRNAMHIIYTRTTLEIKLAANLTKG